MFYGKPSSVSRFQHGDNDILHGYYASANGRRGSVADCFAILEMEVANAGHEVLEGSHDIFSCKDPVACVEDMVEAGRRGEELVQCRSVVTRRAGIVEIFHHGIFALSSDCLSKGFGSLAEGGVLLVGTILGQIAGNKQHTVVVVLEHEGNGLFYLIGVLSREEVDEGDGGGMSKSQFVEDGQTSGVDGY